MKTLKSSGSGTGMTRFYTVPDQSGKGKANIINPVFGGLSCGKLTSFCGLDWIKKGGIPVGCEKQ